MSKITLRPETAITETIAQIDLKGNLLTAKLIEKHEKFRSIVKIQMGMSFDWGDKDWFRKMDQFAGDSRHRLIELCHRLLGAGFVLEVDADLVEEIQRAAYEPEQTRWIKRVVAGEYVDWFSVSWGRHEDFYKVAKRLPGSRYAGKKHYVVIPSVQFETIQDFAQQHGFDLSPGAMELIEIAKAKRNEAILITINQPVNRKRTIAKDVRPALVAVEEQIADEFADDIA